MITRIKGGTSPAHIAALAAAARDSLTNERPPILLDPPSAEPPAPTEIRPNTALLVRTSGSTSASKLVEITWDQLRASTNATHAALGGPGPWLTCLPIEHIAGAQTVLRSVLGGYEPRAYTLGDEVPEGAYVSLVPTQLRRVLADPRLTASLAPARAILVGGQACPPEQLSRGRDAGLRLVTTYGMTETCGGCVYDGQPIGGASVELEDGRIIISGPQVATGYAAGRSFAGRFVTDDAGRWDDAQGRLSVLGRLDDAITTGGLTIMPSVLENHLAGHGIHAVAFGAPHPEWGEALIVVTDRPVEAEFLRTLSRQLGAEYAPKGVACLADLLLDGFPTRPSGKIDRRQLFSAWSRHGEYL